MLIDKRQENLGTYFGDFAIWNEISSVDKEPYPSAIGLNDSAIQRRYPLISVVTLSGA
jgi:hypothetical protein